ncbi:hypothetical protein ACMU_07135 [Actibacterium mucosum KCTC 23349]|uniref:Uncharacterized protein n=1 Tax=Actibacterium mucosum KCTC 23349 TaxID=1454373 RepID=A0A037ZMC3_9RHOB|nr:hypothetical protein ACMU_07135 [Actibacterium mucosum KCTC 23349]
MFSFNGSNFLSVFLNESVRTAYEEYAIRVFMVGELGEQNFGRITVSPVALMDPRKTYFGKSLLREKFASLFPGCEYWSEFLK